MTKWIAAALIAVLASQFSGVACEPQTHAAVVESAGHQHDSHQSPTDSEHPVQSTDCTLMMMCSALTALQPATVTAVSPIYADAYATAAPRMHRDPILITPTPPPRFG